MSDFKGRHFGGEIVLWAVRWYCRYGNALVKSMAESTSIRMSVMRVSGMRL